eukprot:5207-Hanusia_phi.AAC.1
MQLSNMRCILHPTVMSSSSLPPLVSLFLPASPPRISYGYPFKLPLLFIHTGHHIRVQAHSGTTDLGIKGEEPKL